MHDCGRNLEFTHNLYKPFDMDLPVYICRCCKKYYILIKDSEGIKLMEVHYNHDEEIWKNGKNKLDNID